MVVDTRKNMKITCTACSSKYSLSREQIDALPFSVMDCSTCRQRIKIIICPDCSSCYTVSFAGVASPRYMMNCKRCGRSFVVVFPTDQRGSSALKDPLPGQSIEKKVPPAPERSGRNIQRTRIEKPSHAPRSPFISKVEKKSPPGIAASPQQRDNNQRGSEPSLPGNFEVAEVLAAVTGAFSLSRTGAAFAGILTMMISLGLMKSMGSLLQRVPLLGGLWPWLTAGVIFFIYTVAASGMALASFEEMFFKRSLSFGAMTAFMTRSAPSLFGASLLVLIMAEAALLLFGLIPVVGPLLFALLFLPVYGLSLGAVLLVSVGFWFYPPLVAHRKSGVGENVRNIFDFIKKHNLKLIIVIPILAVLSAVIVMVLLLLHQGALMVSAHLAAGIMGPDLAPVLSSVPLSLQSLSDFAGMARAAGGYGMYLGSLLSSASIGGMLLGLVMAGITALLGAIAFSAVSSLSTYAYVALERGSDPGNRKKIFLLLVMILFMVMLLLFRRLTGL